MFFRLTAALSRRLFTFQIAAVRNGSNMATSLRHSDGIVVETNSGPVQGRECTSLYDDVYYSFEKVPFAQPPLGALRFRAPVPVQPWSQLLDCTQTPLKAAQKNVMTNEIEGSEDCLYLSIYAKQLHSKQRLPVLVYIHGGGFERGDATRSAHAPDYFMARDVVLISVAYRLGPFGFLSLADPALQVPGNAGLKDQLLALQWLQQNVACFNGDPNNITLFGESAGAGSAHFLMLAPQAKGLFHKVILLSGTALCPWAMQPLQQLPQRLAQSNGLTADKCDSEVLQFLEQLSTEQILCPHLLTADEHLNDCLFSFGPVVEPYVSEHCIVPRPPIDLLATAWSNELPVIMSGTSFEGLLMYNIVKAKPVMLSDLDQRPERMLPWALQVKHDLDTQRCLALRIREAHFGQRALALENILDYCDYASLKLFWHSIFVVLQSRVRHAAQAATYLCRFDFDSPDFNHHRTKFCGPGERGVAHADDLSYIFYSINSWKLNKQSAEYKTIERMIDLCTAFASSGNPNCSELIAGGVAKWSPLTSTDPPKCLNVSNQLTLIDLPEIEKLRVWESLYKE